MGDSKWAAVVSTLTEVNGGLLRTQPKRWVDQVDAEGRKTTFMAEGKHCNVKHLQCSGLYGTGKSH